MIRITLVAAALLLAACANPAALKNLSLRASSVTIEAMEQRGPYDVWQFGAGGVVEDQAIFTGIVDTMSAAAAAGRILVCDGKLISAHAYGMARQLVEPRPGEHRTGYYTDRCVLGFHASSAFGLVPLRKYTRGQAELWPAPLREDFMSSTHRFRHLTYREYCGSGVPRLERWRCDAWLDDIIPESHIGKGGAPEWLEK